MSEGKKAVLMVLVVFWLCFSWMGSMSKNAGGACGRSYPIDYVIYTNLFCEIKSELIE